MTEQPCKDGAEHEWVWDDNPFGEDMFCQACWITRDWALEDFKSGVVFTEVGHE